MKIVFLDIDGVLNHWDHDTVGPATMSFDFETDEEAEIAAEKLDEVIRDSHV